MFACSPLQQQQQQEGMLRSHAKLPCLSVCLYVLDSRHSSQPVAVPFVNVLNF